MKECTNNNLAAVDFVGQNCAMAMPTLCRRHLHTPRLWAELFPVLRNIKTNDLAKKMLAYKDKPVETWRSRRLGSA